MLLWLAIAVRVVANPCSNALQKLLAARGFAAPVLLALPHAGLTVPVLAAWIWRRSSAPGAFWTWCLLSAALAVAANWLIIEAIRRSDLSLLGPINSYKPVVSLLPGIVLLGEWPGPASLAGIGLVLAGSLLLMDPRPPSGTPRRPFSLVRQPGVQLRFAALLLSAAEAVALKRALALGGPALTFGAWAVGGLLFATPFALRPFARHLRDRPDALDRTAVLGLLALTTTTGLMQFCTVFTLQQLPVGVSLALFQTSTLLTVFLGHTLFREPHFQRRLAGAAVMAAGAVVLVLTR